MMRKHSPNRLSMGLEGHKVRKAEFVPPLAEEIIGKHRVPSRLK